MFADYGIRQRVIKNRKSSGFPDHPTRLAVKICVCVILEHTKEGLLRKKCFLVRFSAQVATFILQKILLDETGLSYICQTYERFSHVAMILVRELFLDLLLCSSLHGKFFGRASLASGSVYLRHTAVVVMSSSLHGQHQTPPHPQVHSRVSSC